MFDSTKVPGEIVDMMVANTTTLKDSPNFGKALVGVWYDTMKLMMAGDTAADGAKTAMGTASGTDLAGFNDQLAATRLFDKPADAVAFTDSPDLKKTMAGATHRSGAAGGHLGRPGADRRGRARRQRGQISGANSPGACSSGWRWRRR